MAVKKPSYDDWMEFARSAQVETNPGFLSAAYRYSELMKDIASMRKQVKADGLISEKTYGGKTNSYAHPLVNEIAKYHDKVNACEQEMRAVVRDFGKAPSTKSKLDMFMLNDA